MGTNGQRRPSRSPRSQRSRSADVDSLKKYTERRVELRRHTETVEPLNPVRWMPMIKIESLKKLPQEIFKFGGDSNSKSSETSLSNEGGGAGRRWLPPTPRRITPFKRPPMSRQREIETRGGVPARSYSSEVPDNRRDKSTELRRHTDCGETIIMSRGVRSF